MAFIIPADIRRNWHTAGIILNLRADRNLPLVAIGLLYDMVSFVRTSVTMVGKKKAITMSLHRSSRSRRSSPKTASVSPCPFTFAAARLSLRLGSHRSDEYHFICSTRMFLRTARSIVDHGHLYGGVPRRHWQEKVSLRRRAAVRSWIHPSVII